MKYVVLFNCHDCGKTLNTTIPMEAKDLVTDWPELTIVAPVNNELCPTGCGVSIIGRNVNAGFQIKEEGTGKVVTYGDLRDRAGA